MGKQNIETKEPSQYLLAPEEKEKPENIGENQVWEKTNDLVGIRSKEPIYCPMCKAREKSVKSEMIMRRSRIHNVADVRIANPTDGNRPYAMDIAYKCPRCDFYCVFGVPIEIEYAQKTLEMRGSKMDYVLPETVWQEDQRIKTRLENWGYW